jgi:hypothetical protein
MNFNPGSKFYMGILAHVIGLLFIVGVTAVDAQNNRSTQKGLDALPDGEVKNLPEKGKRWALIIGINKYEKSKSISPLIGAENDALALKGALKEYAGFPENQIVLMTTGTQDDSLKPTRGNILTQLSRITDKVGEDGLFLFAFSGHGISTPDGQAFLLPSDADMIPRLFYLVDSAVAVKRIQDYINDSHIKQVIVLLDACRNVPRQGAKGNDATPMTEGFKFNQLNKDVKVAVTMYATAPGKFAWEHMATKRGYFMEAVVNGLSGEAADKKTGDITLGSLIDYVGNTVQSNTAREDSQQVPFFDTSGNSQRLVIAKTKVSFKVPFSIRTYPLTVDAKVIIRSQGKTIREGTSVDGELTADLDQGTYEVEVSANKYKTEKKQISVSVRGKTVETFTLAQRTGSIVVYLADTISPDDKNLRVFLDGNQKSFTKVANTLVLSDIDEGDHRLRVDHPNIMESFREATISLKGGEERAYSVPAKPPVPTPSPGSSLGAFSLNANVSSARVVIRSEGKVLREGEIQKNEFHTNLPSGTYDVEVMADKHKPKPWKKQITIEQGRSLSEAVVLTSEVGSIVVDLDTIAPGDKGLQILLDGRRVNFTKRADNRVELTDIEEGTHQLRVEHPSAILVSEKVDLQGGGVMNYHLYLKPATTAAPTPTTGTLAIGVNVPTARVVIKSKTSGFHGERVATTDLRFELPPGSYDVEVIADKYRVWKQTVLINLGDVKTLPVALEPDVVQVTIKGPANASIYLDKSLKGTITSTGELVLADIIPGNHTIEAKLSGFKDSRVEKNFTANEALNIKLTAIVADASPWSERFESLEYWDAPRSWSLGWNGQKNVVISGTEVGLEKRSYYGNFELEFNINIIKGKQAAWVVRATDTRSYYLFVLEKSKERAKLYEYTSKDGELSPRRSLGDFSGELPDQLHVLVTATGKDIRTDLDLPDGRQLLGVFSGAQDLPIGRIGFRAFADGEQFVVLDLQCRLRN